MKHIACLGHGSLEATDSFGRDTRTNIQAPHYLQVVFYTPFGAAIEGGLADDIFKSLVNMRPQQLNVIEGYLALLRQAISLRPRESKGASPFMHQNIQFTSEYPKALTAYPDFTLTGSTSIPYSGIYDATLGGKCLRQLGSGEALSLNSIIETYCQHNHCYVHWLACRSDRGSFAQQLGTEGSLLKAGIG